MIHDLLSDPVALTIGTILAVLLLSLGIAEYTAKKEDAPVDWKNFGRIVEQLAPVILKVVPGVPPGIVPAVTYGIQLAEAIPGATGPQKKEAALGLVNTAIAATNTAAGKQLVDPTVINAVSNGIDTLIGVVNVVQNHPVAPDADLSAPPA